MDTLLRIKNKFAFGILRSLPLRSLWKSDFKKILLLIFRESNNRPLFCECEKQVHGGKKKLSIFSWIFFQSWGIILYLRLKNSDVKFICALQPMNKRKEGSKLTEKNVQYMLVIQSVRAGKVWKKRWRQRI